MINIDSRKHRTSEVLNPSCFNSLACNILHTIIGIKYAHYCTQLRHHAVITEMLIVLGWVKGTGATAVY